MTFCGAGIGVFNPNSKTRLSICFKPALCSKKGAMSEDLSERIQHDLGEVLDLLEELDCARFEERRNILVLLVRRCHNPHVKRYILVQRELDILEMLAPYLSISNASPCDLLSNEEHSKSVLYILEFLNLLISYRPEEPAEETTQRKRNIRILSNHRATILERIIVILRDLFFASSNVDSRYMPSRFMIATAVTDVLISCETGGLKLAELQLATGIMQEPSVENLFGRILWDTAREVVSYAGIAYIQSYDVQKQFYFHFARSFRNFSSTSQRLVCATFFYILHNIVPRKSSQCETEAGADTVQSLLTASDQDLAKGSSSIPAIARDPERVREWFKNVMEIASFRKSWSGMRNPSARFLAQHFADVYYYLKSSWCAQGAEAEWRTLLYSLDAEITVFYMGNIDELMTSAAYVLTRISTLQKGECSARMRSMLESDYGLSEQKGTLPSASIEQCATGLELAVKILSKFCVLTAVRGQADVMDETLQKRPTSTTTTCQKSTTSKSIRLLLLTVGFLENLQEPALFVSVVKAAQRSLQKILQDPALWFAVKDAVAIASNPPWLPEKDRMPCIVNGLAPLKKPGIDVHIPHQSEKQIYEPKPKPSSTLDSIVVDALAYVSTLLAGFARSREKVLQRPRSALAVRVGARPAQIRSPTRSSFDVNQRSNGASIMEDVGHWREDIDVFISEDAGDLLAHLQQQQLSNNHLPLSEAVSELCKQLCAVWIPKDLPLKIPRLNPLIPTSTGGKPHKLEPIDHPPSIRNRIPSTKTIHFTSGMVPTPPALPPTTIIRRHIVMSKAIPANAI
ncbi:hypothetical protein DFS34DRAFT_243856 [Phlyctochytrium arcticum]|nr:hypothetical protein DFS34DRAFT_243856 [Phlyctochytrium arcticum]